MLYLIDEIALAENVRSVNWIGATMEGATPQCFALDLTKRIGGPGSM